MDGKTVRKVRELCCTFRLLICIRSVQQLFVKFDTNLFISSNLNVNSNIVLPHCSITKADNQKRTFVHFSAFRKLYYILSYIQIAQCHASEVWLTRRYSNVVDENFNIKLILWQHKNIFFNSIIYDSIIKFSNYSIHRK